jgi:hypothetical protein
MLDRIIAQSINAGLQHFYFQKNGSHPAQAKSVLLGCVEHV